MPQHEAFASVTQLAAELGVSVRTLHFYETQGLITPRRAGSTRVYTRRDHARMIIILRGKRLGFSIREIKEYLELYDVDPMHEEQLKTLLKAVHGRMHRLEDQRIALDETLTELRSIERQAEIALKALRTAPEPASIKKPQAKSRRPARTASGKIPGEQVEH